jgi:hypothetical protein
MFGRFLPRETSFFDDFERHNVLVVEACKVLRSLDEVPSEIAQKAARIKELERQADDITHHCIDALHKTFITPLDRADIHNLMNRMDDIIDAVDAVTTRLVLYEITEIRHEVREMADVLVRASEAIGEALRHMRRINQPQTIKEKCIVIYELENQGDQLLRTALVRLFKEGDAIQVIKWKEILERLEKASDRCEAVANIIQGVVIEAS